MIPDYQTLMLPVLKSCAQGEVVTRDVIDKLADDFNLTSEEREELLPSGKQARFDNRVHWAKGYLKQAGLVTFTARSHFVISEIGQRVLSENPTKIDNKFLDQFDAFQDFKSRKGTQAGNVGKQEPSSITGQDATPDEILRASHKTINDALAAELLDRVRNETPQFFEELIIGLLLAMGYGGTASDAGRALGQSGDSLWRYNEYTPPAWRRAGPSGPLGSQERPSLLPPQAPGAAIRPLGWAPCGRARDFARQNPKRGFWGCYLPSLPKSLFWAPSGAGRGHPPPWLRSRWSRSRLALAKTRAGFGVLAVVPEA